MENNVWEQPCKIQPLHTDRNCKCTLAAISQIFQDTAEEHTLNAGYDYFSLMKEGRAWVLSRVYYEILQCPRIYDCCRVRTWSRGVDGVFALRDFEIYDAENQVAVRGTTKWLIINVTTRHLVRDSNFVNVFPHCEKSAVVHELGKMLPHAGLQQVAEFEVPFSAIDKAQHVNNAVYLQWIVDNFLPEDFDRDIRSVEINYVRETKIGEKAVVKRFKEDGTYHFEIDNGSGVSVLGKIQMSE